MLALDRGGSVRGVVFRIASEIAVQEMDILWRREMINNSYKPRWLSVHTDNGVKNALCFVVRRDCPGFAERMPDEITVESLQGLRVSSALVANIYLRQRGRCQRLVSRTRV